MIKKIRNHLKKIKYLEEKKRLVKIGVILILILFVSFGLLGKAFASYQSSLKLNANIDQALYVFGGENMSFNIDPSKIVPSSTPYTYKFSVSNYDANKQSDINIEYTVDVKTTTNLPIILSLYRNSSTTNLLSSVNYKQDNDGSWYRIYETTDVYTMSYNSKVTDVYILEVLFPVEYSKDTTYADSIENIEVILKSKQVID